MGNLISREAPGTIIYDCYHVPLREVAAAQRIAANTAVSYSGAVAAMSDSGHDDRRVDQSSGEVGV